MSPRMITVAAFLTIIACADPSPFTSPEAAGPLTLSPGGAPCTVEEGQQQIDAGEYKKAIHEFTCVIDLDPTAVEGYRGRIEAELMLGLYSDAMRDYTRVTAFVEPVNPAASQVIFAGYKARLDLAPDAITALTGLSFAYWYFFDYPAAMHVLDQLLALQPNDVYGNLFRGSSRVLRGTKRAAGVADLDRAIALAPTSPDVRWIDADAFTYGTLPDPQRAFDQATLALGGGLNTPRIRAIRAASYLAFGNAGAAAAEIAIHLQLVTTDLVGTAPLVPGSSMSLGLVPGRTYEIPIAVSAGQRVEIATSSKDFWDTILVLLAADGAPVVGSDDFKGYLAGLDWIAPEDGEYRLRVSSFEAVNTGMLLVAWK